MELLGRKDLEVLLIMNLGIGLGLLLEIELGILLGLTNVYRLRNRTGTTVRNRIRNRTNNELRNRNRTIRRNKLRGTTISAAPQNNIFHEYIFIETKLLPLPPPTLKPIPIPPSRPNDLKHIAININV